MTKKFLPIVALFFVIAYTDDVSDAKQNKQTQDNAIHVENGRLVFRDVDSCLHFPA